MAEPLINALGKAFIIATAAKQYTYLKFHTCIRNRGNLAYHYKKDSQVFHCHDRQENNFGYWFLLLFPGGDPAISRHTAVKRELPFEMNLCEVTNRKKLIVY
jgi:hypothetical protein